MDDDNDDAEAGARGGNRIVHTSIRVQDRRIFVQLRCLTSDWNAALALVASHHAEILARVMDAAAAGSTEVWLRLGTDGVAPELPVPGQHRVH